MSASERFKIDLSKEEAMEIENKYDGLLGILKKLSGEIDVKVVRKISADSIDIIIESLSSETKDEAILLYTSKIFDKDYIFAHSLNVCIISIMLGLRLDFDKERLKDLGFLALLHAGGDIKLPEGLSAGIKHDKELDEIVRLADIYDALTHPPSYRHATTPAETLVSITAMEQSFDKKLVKILLQELTFYPKGAWVQLCTDEIARVVKINKMFPLRPTVEVFTDSEGGHLKGQRTIDLSKDHIIFISRPMTGEETKRIREG